MTQHPDFPHSPARRRATHRTGKTGAVLLAAVVLVGSAMVPASASGPTAVRSPVSAAEAAATEPATAVAAAEGPLSVSVTSISHPVAEPGDEVTIRASITNTTDAAISGAEAALSVDFLALTSRSDIAEWAEADLLDRTFNQPTVESVPNLAPGASTEVSFTYDPAVAYLRGFGPRRFAITVDDATGRIGVAHSFLLYDADGTERQPMELSVLAGVTGTASDLADEDMVEIELAQLAASGQRLDGVVEVAENSDLSLAVDPAVPAVAAESSDEALTDWYDRLLAAAENTATYALPNHDPDLAALAHANIRTTGGGSFLNTPRLGTWTMPESWRSTLAWPADGGMPDVETLGLAVTAERPDVIVNGGLEPVNGGPATGRAEVSTPAGTAHAVVTDPTLTQAFLSATDLFGAEVASATETTAGATDLGTATTTAEGTQRLLAETAAIASQSPADPPAMAIVAPRTWTPDAEAAAAILNALDDSDWVTTTTLDTLLGQDAPDVARTPLPDRQVIRGELNTASVAALERARDAVITFSAVAGDNPAPISRPGVIRLAGPLSVAHRADPGLREVLVQRTLDAVTALTKESVSVVPRQDINFITDVGNIPVRVRNELPVDATVTVVLRPDHPRLTVDARRTETIPAGQEIDVQVPVRAIGSGDVEVAAQLLTPTGAKFTDDSSFQVRVRAGWEEVGTWIAAGLVALLFLAGIWRTVRRGRSPYRATSKDVEEAVGTSAEPPEPAPMAATDSVTVRAE
ncbi:DUF6049 family protein [Promicromonospora sp. Populi]|uniref:DUF6049 family protein n=1 Tax=Promicromonospora sp. Populi TaxID=3239420 RepID=UPI0034E2B3F9